MNEYLKHVPNWSSFKSLGASKTIKSSYWWLFLVPALAKSFESVEETLTFTLFGASIDVNLSLPFSWSMFYFSAIFFAGASLLFATRCPQAIKKYSNFEEWKEIGKDSTALVRTYIYLYRTKKTTWPNPITEKQMKQFLKVDLEYTGNIDSIINEGISTIGLMKHGVPNDNLKAVYYRVNDKIDRTRVLDRILLELLYGLGFFFFFIVLYENFIYVIKHV